ncbi:MAG TPA: hypothetical protein VFZ85_15635 [Jiangellaceae bacterium]
MRADDKGWPDRANSGIDAAEAPRNHGASAHGRSGDANGGGYRRPWLGVLAAVGVFALVAVPAGWFAIFAIAGFTGCFIECAQPEPGTGVLWASLATVLLVLPVVVGLIVARVPLRRGLPWLIGLVAAVALGGILAQRII